MKSSSKHDLDRYRQLRAAGSPVNPTGHRTAYLWETVWARASWLEILGRYVIAQRDKKKQIERIIFPRFHQLDVTRKLQSAVLAHGPGGKYLAQHSAGSGKTNSIAWTAHFFAELHNASNQKVFDTVLVVSDRTMIDAQLQEALFDFHRQTGVVATITGNDSSKSGELAAALSGDKKSWCAPFRPSRLHWRRCGSSRPHRGSVLQ